MEYRAGGTLLDGSQWLGNWWDSQETALEELGDVSRFQQYWIESRPFS